MPTKPNRAGEQQNYVPKGNGDPSGEYGDNTSGSNKHITFEKFEKKEPIKEEPIHIEQGDDNGTHFPSGKDDAKTINNMLKNKAFSDFSSKQLKYYEPIIKKADASCNKMIVDGINKRDITYKKGGGYFMAGSGVIAVGTNDGTQIYVDGSIFYHENGHMVDYNGQTDQNKTLSMTYISKKYNKNLIDMLDEEYSNIDEVVSDYNAKVKEIELQVDNLPTMKEYNEIQKSWNDIRDKVNKDEEIINKTHEMQKEQDAIYAEYRKLGGDRLAYSERIYKNQKELDELIDKKYPEYKQLQNQMLNNPSPKFVLMNKATDEINKTYGDISDVYSMRNHVTNGFGAGGHSASYSRKGGKSQRATELFAEMFQAKAVNEGSRELFKKTFPKTWDIFEEIVKEHN